MTEFEGIQLLAFTLRSVARKLGYLRGQTLDGPSFDEYEKPFPSIRLGDVPRVLLSEVYDDLRVIAGSGRRLVR